MHAAEISRESIRLGSSIRGAREEMREREAWATWECKAGQKEGGERRLSLLLSRFVYVVDPSSYAHVTQLGRAGERRAVGSSTWARSFAHWQRWSVYCACHGGGGEGGGRGSREGAKEGAKRGEKADLLDLLAQYDTTGPPGGKRASERARNEQPCLLTNRTSAMHHSEEDPEHGSRGKKEMCCARNHFSRPKTLPRQAGGSQLHPQLL